MIRIKRIELNRFKNTKHGVIDFWDSSLRESITGIYGQNGSGKTAVVDALGLLQDIMAGSELPPSSEHLISKGCDSAQIFTTFYISAEDMQPYVDAIMPEGYGCLINGKESCVIDYSIEIARKKAIGGLYISAETVAISSPSVSKRTLVSYAVSEVSPDDLRQSDRVEVKQLGIRPEDDVRPSFKLGPTGKWRSLLAAGGSVRELVESSQRLAYARGTSLVFSNSMLAAFNALRTIYVESKYGERNISKSFGNAFEDVAAPLFATYFALSGYVIGHMQVLTTLRGSVLGFDRIMLDTLESGTSIIGPKSERHFINLAETDTIEPEKTADLKATIDAMDKVLKALVPGLTIEVSTLGKETDAAGNEVERIELLSNREGTIVPFRFESEGIKKLVSVMSQLISFYRDENALIVVDEFDAGVFEFLLGELLEVLHGKGKGQLIFTAHNLRPLEMLPAKSIVFTTTNPDNRYVRFKGYRPTNNLRDLYIRAINLGGQNESVYEPTSKLAIDAGFYDASHPEEASSSPEDIVASIRGANG